ncbi:MAG: response regulator transcription factor [Campylobacterota bacterium]|nr:response regulator transcription factor [Campylobacterota bacterium]
MRLEKNISILVAEDETELREYLVEYLEIFFENVYSVKCGQEAYDIYLEKSPNIILSDINMPNLDGLSMISKIRESDKETKIIIMSAHSDTEKLLHAVELNLVTYLIKPIKIETLKKVLFDTVEKIKSSSSKVYLGSDMYWDTKENRLYSNAEHIILKERESMLMTLLCSKGNQAFSNETIFEYLYTKSDKAYSEYAITSLIKRLRSKLPKNIIHNEYGSGYKIRI